MNETSGRHLSNKEICFEREFPYKSLDVLRRERSKDQTMRVRWIMIKHKQSKSRHKPIDSLLVRMIFFGVFCFGVFVQDKAFDARKVRTKEMLKNDGVKIFTMLSEKSFGFPS